MRNIGLGREFQSQPTLHTFYHILVCGISWLWLVDPCDDGGKYIYFFLSWTKDSIQSGLQRRVFFLYYVLPTTSYSCALSAFGARTASGINPYRIGRFSRGPVPNASKRQFGSANLGSPGPLYDKATQGCQSESCLGGWRCKDPSEEVDRRRRGWTAYRKISRPSARSRARAKDGSGSHSELLSRMDGTG